MNSAKEFCHGGWKAVKRGQLALLPCQREGSFDLQPSASRVERRRGNTARQIVHNRLLLSSYFGLHYFLKSCAKKTAVGGQTTRYIQHSDWHGGMMAGRSAYGPMNTNPPRVTAASSASAPN